MLLRWVVYTCYQWVALRESFDMAHSQSIIWFPDPPRVNQALVSVRWLFSCWVLYYSIYHLVLLRFIGVHVTITLSYICIGRKYEGFLGEAPTLCYIVFIIVQQLWFILLSQSGTGEMLRILKIEFQGGWFGVYSRHRIGPALPPAKAFWLAQHTLLLYFIWGIVH